MRDILSRMKYMMMALLAVVAGCGRDIGVGAADSPAPYPEAPEIPNEPPPPEPPQPPPPPPPPIPSGPPAFESGAVWGTVESPLVIEASGLAASRRHPGVLWVNNDSGDGPNLYAITTSGRHLGVYTLEGVRAEDWEALAIGPGPVPGVDYLYAADIGDNSDSRSEVQVYRVAEPSVALDQEPVEVTLSGVDDIHLVYEHGPMDAEALIVDPLNGDLLIVTKDLLGRSRVYHKPAPHAAGEWARMAQVANLDPVLQTTDSPEVTDATMSYAGDLLLVRTYLDGLLWVRSAGATWAEVFASSPSRVPIIAEPQGEAVAFDATASGYFTTSEGSHEPIYFFARKP